MSTKLLVGLAVLGAVVAVLLRLQSAKAEAEAELWAEATDPIPN